MKTIKDLISLIDTGKRPIVTFGQGITKLEEIYPEPGMRARILRFEKEDYGSVKVHFEFDEFLSHNTPFESANYFDKAGQPTLTAQEAGFYRPTEEIYFMVDDALDGLIAVESDAASALFESYRAEDSTLTYLQWLEAKVLASLNPVA